MSIEISSQMSENVESRDWGEKNEIGPEIGYS